eukprot:1183229-Prymnesium_polylepis.1
MVARASGASVRGGEPRGSVWRDGAVDAAWPTSRYLVRRRSRGDPQRAPPAVGRCRGAWRVGRVPRH